jgi:DNA-binding transcriptional LysR family regulator
MMELRQLRYLASLAREGQFTRAAARLNVAQPALSQQVRKLEDELGVALVDRTPHGARLTVAGERAVARARSILAEVDALREEIGELAGLTGGRVTVGVTPASGPVDVAAILGAFQRDRPAIELAVLERLSVERALVAEGLAVAILPRSDAERPGPPIAAVALAGRGLAFEVFLAWRRDRRQAPATRAFIGQVVSHRSGHNSDALERPKAGAS